MKKREQGYNIVGTLTFIISVMIVAAIGLVVINKLNPKEPAPRTSLPLE